MTRRVLRTAGALLGAVALIVADLTALVLPAAGQGLRFVEVWSRVLPDAGRPVALSSPNVAVLGGVRAVIVGDRAGYLYAFSLANGRAIRGWPASTQGIPIDATPSVAPLDSRSPDDTVFVGVGDAATPHKGGYEAFNPDGTETVVHQGQEPGHRPCREGDFCRPGVTGGRGLARQHGRGSPFGRPGGVRHKCGHGEDVAGLPMVHLGQRLYDPGAG